MPEEELKPIDNTSAEEELKPIDNTSAEEELKPIDNTPEKMPSWAKQILEENKKMKEKLSMFESMAGENAVKSWKEKQKDFKNKFANLKVYGGKLVVGWSNLDMSAFNPKASDSISENILTELYYSDGEKEKVNYVLFGREKEMISAEIISFNEISSELEFSEDDIKRFKLESSRLTIPTKFLNA